MRARSDPSAPEKARSRFNGLRGRMALLLLAVLLLPAGYAIANAINQYMHQNELRQAELQRTARLIADHQANALSNLRTWLEQIADVETLPLAGPDCNAGLRAKRDEMRLVTHLSIVSGNGRILCSADAAHVGDAVTDQFWFQRAIRGSPFTVSELQPAPDVENADQTLMLAVPLYTGDNWLTSPTAPQGVLVAALDLDAFSVTWRNLDLSAGAEIFLIDRLGQRVPSLPWPADGIHESALETLLRGERRSIEIALPDERTALLATASIGFTGLQVVVGIPVNRLDWLRAEVLTPILLPVVMLLAGVVATFAGTHLVVNRHVERLARAVRQHRPGDRSLIHATAHAPNELQELGAHIAGLTEDLEEREESLQRLLTQKDLLLREVNHRVKNNLQVVASLLRMRARGGPTAESRAAIRDAHARIEAIALVHRRIYEEEAVEEVDLSSFLSELLDHLGKSIGNERVTISLTGDFAGVKLATGRAVSVALLVTELVTNAIEHAFTDSSGDGGIDGGHGLIEISLARQADEVRMVVADNGKGFDPEAGHSGTGIHLSKLLARQLGGELVFASSKPGTRASFRLPLAAANGA